MITRARPHRLNSEQGFSLPELLIACSVAFFLLLGIFVLLQTMRSQNAAVTLTATTQEIAWRLHSRINSLLSQAIDTELDTSGASLNAFDSGTSSRGKFRTYSATSGADGSFETVAVFNRENGLNEGELIPTAIFYRKPTPDEPGAVFIDQGFESELSPDLNDEIFDQIVEFEATPNAITTPVTDPDGTVHQILVSAEFRVVFRYFMTAPAKGPGNGAWCPKADMLAAATGCNTKTSFHDVEMVFRVNLLNNLMNQNLAMSAQNAFAGRYFFKMLYPTEGR